MSPYFYATGLLCKRIDNTTAEVVNGRWIAVYTASHLVACHLGAVWDTPKPILWRGDWPKGARDYNDAIAIIEKEIRP
jgi:hypothetical protein